ncbi:hypothetical protein GCM10027275_10210 [Rhabdobacter roseus]
MNFHEKRYYTILVARSKATEGLVQQPFGIRRGDPGRRGGAGLELCASIQMHRLLTVLCRVGDPSPPERKARNRLCVTLLMRELGGKVPIGFLLSLNENKTFAALESL